MHVLKSISVLFIFLFAVNSFSADTFEFFPQKHTANLEADHIWFVDNDSNEKKGPELYADETDSEFFAFVKKNITTAKTDNTEIILLFEKINSKKHGSYKKIIPEF